MAIYAGHSGTATDVPIDRSTPYRTMATIGPAQVPILDIRAGPTEFDLLQDIKRGLRPANGGEKTLPTLLLYDEIGLRLFEKITYLEEYYLTNAEIEVLETYAERIAQRIRPGSVVVELGSGNLRKVDILLQAIDRAGKDVEYYAVDVQLTELERTFAEIPTSGYKHVKCSGLFGTYDHALEWLKSDHVHEKPKTILWLGSSLGNFKRPEVPPFLSGFRDALAPGDSMLIGVDSCKDSDRVFHAYNDKDGVTHDFTLNGLKHANRIMKADAAFKLDEWEAIGEYDVEAGRHHAFVSPVKDVVVDGVSIPKGERIRIEESYKYSRQEVVRLWQEAGLVESMVWKTSRGDYGLHFVSKPVVFFPSDAAEYASNPVPSITEWHQMWAAWDAITRDMIPDEQMLSKPIKLRNACIFYLGHIPTFLDIHISRATGATPTEPAYFRKIFERGVDPDVDNPEHCHDHSEIPEDWPPVEEIIRFQNEVRAKIEALYVSGAAQTDVRVARAMWFGFEHEAMHLETLLYMLIQSDKVVSPPGAVAPDFEALARQSESSAVENQWFEVPASDLILGLNDPEPPADCDHYFGWDNEKPPRSVHVRAFKSKARPITNGEYAEYLKKTGQTNIPASWCNASSSTNKTDVTNGHATANGHTNGHSNGHSNGHTNGHSNGYSNGHANGNDAAQSLTTGKYVRTVFGPVPFEYAVNWPVMASYDELGACAHWMGGRIPTMEEARSIYNYAERTRSKDFVKALGQKIPAVNGHLLHDGVQETPPSASSSRGAPSATLGPDPQSLFIDLNDANVGFQHWHPVSVAEKGGKLCGQSDMGGVWEWTSTVLDKHQGFEAMDLYPGYTADFYDGKHNVTLGGSWATHTRLAGRKTFVNWYQRNYPYVWAGARVVRDL